MPQSKTQVLFAKAVWTKRRGRQVEEPELLRMENHWNCHEQKGDERKGDAARLGLRAAAMTNHNNHDRCMLPWAGLGVSLRKGPGDPGPTAAAAGPDPEVTMCKSGGATAVR